MNSSNNPNTGYCCYSRYSCCFGAVLLMEPSRGIKKVPSIHPSRKRGILRIFMQVLLCIMYIMYVFACQLKSKVTWLVSELSLLLSGSSWELTKVDNSEADCVVNGVYWECKWVLLDSCSSSSSMPWWHSTKCTNSSFSLHVSVGTLWRSRYWRRSFTLRRMSRGRWKAVAFSKWQVAQMRRFSWSTQQRVQKLFLQSQQMYF